MAVIGIGTTSRVSVSDVAALIAEANLRLAAEAVPPRPSPLPPASAIGCGHLAIQARQGELVGRGSKSGWESSSVLSPLGERDRVRGSPVLGNGDILTALASLDRAEVNDIIHEAACRMRLQFILLSLDQLAAVAHLCIARSEKSMERYGIPSVAEAAALAAAGEGARLILPRFCGRNTTASVAA